MGSKSPIARQEPLPRAADTRELMGGLKLWRGGRRWAAGRGTLVKESAGRPSTG